jgi:[NiFe] hydrogenase diaphorase moiety large subunit
MKPFNSRKTQLTFDEVLSDGLLSGALKKSRAGIIAEVAASGLRGRGGAGFPTATKWNLAAAVMVEPGKSKYVICNADEGEPGTFKDRLILEDYAGLVFDGMTIAARAIGATKGLVYLRGEYAYLREHLESISQRRRKQNLLGNQVLGHEDFDFDIEIRMGSGVYICGEETALIESLEGQRGEPRNRPPFPINTGFLGQPTVVNNVETLTWVSCILSKGSEWFRRIGTDNSSGLKLFSISGDCRDPGVYELPLGIAIIDLLKKAGGEDAKAVQIGGASGFCVAACDFGRKIAFEDVSTGGAVIVFGPTRDMLKVAKNFMEFFVDESCGQCTPCRDGNAKLLEGIEWLEEGKCSTSYLQELMRLGQTMQLASKCGLGQSSSNAFTSIINNFKSEFMGRRKHV